MGLENILLGFEVAFTPYNLMVAVIGIMLGTIIGVLPGLGGANGVAILLPLTFHMPPTSAIILLTLFAPLLARLALKFGPPEFFAIQMLTFASFIGLGGADPFKSIISIALGFILACVGLDIVTGQLRLTFGLTPLMGGFDFIVAAIGPFGIGQNRWCGVGAAEYEGTQ